jgi:hypothetical protein
LGIVHLKSFINNLVSSSHSFNCLFIFLTNSISLALFKVGLI